MDYFANVKGKYWHAAFLLLLIAAFALRIDVLFGAYLVLAFFVVVLGARAFRSTSSAERILMGLFILCMTLVLPVSALRHASALVHYPVALISLGAAFVLTRNRAAYLHGSTWSLVAVQLAVLAYLGVNGVANFPLENMIPDSSSNGITSYLIVLQVNYSLVKFVERRRASLPSALVTLAICVVGYGRGSILAATLIVLTNMLSYLSWEKLHVGVLRALAGLLVVTVVAVFYSQDIGLFIEANTKIGSGLFDEARDRILTEYGRKIDPLTLVVGADYEGTTIVSDFNGNPHNSFIRAHHIFGLPYLLVLLLFPLALLRVRQPWQVKCYAAALLITVLFRSSTEPILFPTLFDFYFFAFCFALLGPGTAAAHPTEWSAAARA